MASVIKIKRSEVSGNPSVLGAGELAYSALPDNGVNGGDRLYIGSGTETDGNAVNHVVIGGKFFTDMLDHTKGALTANSAIVVDSNSKIDVINVDNITIDGNGITSTDLNGDITITPNGSGRTVVTNLFIGGNSITEFVQDITGGQLVAGEGIDITYNDSDGTSTIDAEIATASNLGVASFDAGDFVVLSGAVSIKDAGVGNVQLENDSVTFGTTEVELGSSSTSLAGLTSLDVDELNLNDGTISNTQLNGSVTLAPNGTGTVDVSNKRITSVAAPTSPTDAANKEYVDDVAQGLHALPAAEAATTTDLNATFNSGANTLTGNSNGAIVIDTVTLSVGDNLLVKDQTNAWENGSYVVTQTGDGTSPFILTRCDFCDETSEVPGAFEFVTAGSTYGNTGWVATVPDGFTLNATDGSGDITWVQFSGAGTFTAGDGLVLDGTEFNVVGTADRISVTADSIDISATYAGQNTITTLGTITTGTWEGSIVDPTYGGTGVNNGSSTITIGGNLTVTGAFSTEFTVTANTSVTLPNSGTLATLDGTEALSNKTITASSIGSSNPSTGAFTTLSASGLVTFTDTTETDATNTGALVVGGGVGVGKSLYVGLDLVGSGASTSSLDGFEIDGGTY